MTAKDSATLETLRRLCADSSNGGGGATASQWKLAASEQGVAPATFDRAKKRLLDLGLVDCDQPGQVGALYLPRD
jgi:hypothetical protein